MRKLSALAGVLLLAASACTTGGSESRVALVDFSHDEFASYFLLNFPDRVTVHPGTTLVFRQTWTGEPHTVTAGTLVEEQIEATSGWTGFFEAFDALAATGAEIPSPDAPGEATMADLARAVEEATDDEAREAFVEAYDALRAAGAPFPDLADPSDMSFDEFVELVEEGADAAFEGLLWAMDDDEDGEFDVTQNAGQPCYLTEGLPPSDARTPCPDDRQEQPVFDGSHSYYNSGIIPYEGPGGNTFEVPLSADIEPGTYVFYCAVHGPMQRTEVEVVSPDVEVPTQGDINRRAREEIGELTEPLERLFGQATTEGYVELGGERIEGPFAGLVEPSVGPAGINEFVPRRLTVRAGEPITWKMMGAPHTITFDVPEYFPIVEFLDDGTIRMNPALSPPAGGAPEPPEQEGPGVLRVDGGTYDGEGFWSSGLIQARPYLEYTLRASRPGTYRYACLLHPSMVGTLEVTEEPA